MDGGVLELLFATAHGEVRVFLIAVVGEGVDGDAASRHELTSHLDIAGIHKCPQVLHYYVHAVFMEISMVAE